MTDVNLFALHGNIQIHKVSENQKELNDYFKTLSDSCGFKLEHLINSKTFYKADVEPPLRAHTIY